jgi:transposase
MSKDELHALATDIKKNGLRNPTTIVEGEDGNPILLDGRNRLDALELLDDEERLNLRNCLVFEQRDRESLEPYAYVVSLNIHRRHLTGEQKRDLIAKLLKAKPETSNRQIATQVKVDHKTVATVRKEKEATGEIPQLKERTGKDGKARKQPAKKKRRTPDDFTREVKEKLALEAGISVDQLTRSAEVIAESGMKLGNARPSSRAEQKALIKAERQAIAEQMHRSWQAHKLKDYASGNVSADVVNKMITAGHHALAKESHPDVGGSHEDMLIVNQAAEDLKGGKKVTKVVEWWTQDFQDIAAQMAKHFTTKKISELCAVAIDLKKAVQAQAANGRSP